MITIGLLNITPSLFKEFYLVRLAIAKNYFFIGFIGYTGAMYQAVSYIFSLFMGRKAEYRFGFVIELELFGHKWKWMKNKNDDNNRANSDNP